MGHSFFAAIWFVPLVLRLFAILFRVRRTPLVVTKNPESEGSDKSLTEPLVFELDKYKHGFVLIQAPEALGTQIFRHFGYPQRSDPSSDRCNERVLIGLTIAAGAYVPVSWVVFAFAPSVVRWTWICYQLYMLVSLVVLTFWDLSRVGSLKEEITDALHGGRLFVSATTIPDTLWSTATKSRQAGLPRPARSLKQRR